MINEQFYSMEKFKVWPFFFVTFSLDCSLCVVYMKKNNIFCVGFAIESCIWKLDLFYLFFASF